MRKFFAGIDKRSFWTGFVMAVGGNLLVNGMATAIAWNTWKSSTDDNAQTEDENDEESKEATRDQVKEAVKQATEVLEKEDK